MGASSDPTLLHGSLASRRYFMPTAKVLANSVRVFVPELPGHGASSNPARALTALQQANVLFEWFRQNNLKRAHMVANSYGCQIAAHLATIHPEIFETLTLTGPTCDPAARTMLQQLYRLHMDGKHEPKGGFHQLIDDLSDMGPVIALETGHRLVEDDIRENLSGITCPALVLCGEYDTVAPPEWSREVASRIPGAKFCVIPNAPHCVNYATPVELSRIVLRFMRDRIIWNDSQLRVA